MGKRTGERSDQEEKEKGNWTAARVRGQNERKVGDGRQ